MVLKACKNVIKNQILPVEPNSSSNTPLPKLLMDSGASRHVVDPQEQGALQGDGDFAHADEIFHLPNGHTMTGTKSIKLPIPVDTPADVGIVLNEMAGGSILSIAQLADSGHSTTFTPTEVQVKNDADEIVMSVVH